MSISLPDPQSRPACPVQKVTRVYHAPPRALADLMDASTSLWALFTSSFLAATLLPGGSELVLYGVLELHPEKMWLAIGIATIGNTLGGLTSYAIGRAIPRPKSMNADHVSSPSTPRKVLEGGESPSRPRKVFEGGESPSKPRKDFEGGESPSKPRKDFEGGGPPSKPMKGLTLLQRYGSPALLLSWVPLIGDPLCVAAGWLRMNAVAATGFIAAGKLARYVAIAALTT
jgi:membrane protein YqaA with SNARE-associated domain